MPAVPSMGHAAQLGIGTANPVGKRYEFKSENITKKTALVTGDGIRGTREHFLDRLRQGLISVGGSVVLEPSPNELTDLMPFIMGGAAQAGAGFSEFDFTESLVANGTFYVQVDRVAKVFTYAGCVVDTATFSCAPGQAMQLVLGIEGLTETIGNAGTFPSLTIEVEAPFVMHDGTLTIAGTAYQMHNFQLTINNFIKKDRWVNSQTRTDLPPMDRTVMLSCTIPYTSDTTGLYDGAVTGANAVILLASGGAGEGASGKSITFTLSKVVSPAGGNPFVASKDEITMMFTGEARKTGSTASLKVKIDETA